MEGEIKVYSSPFCPYCVTLKKFLEKHNVKFEEVDVSEDKEAAQYMMEKSGQAGIPVTEVEDEMIVGFNKEKLKKVLEIEE